MEEDIKVLEELKNRKIYFSSSYFASGYVELDKKEKQAIENLINRNKELELENKTFKALKNSCPALSTTGVECEFKKRLEKLEKGDK